MKNSFESTRQDSFLGFDVIIKRIRQIQLAITSSRLNYQSIYRNYQHRCFLLYLRQPKQELTTKHLHPFSILPSSIVSIFGHIPTTLFTQSLQLYQQFCFIGSRRNSCIHYQHYKLQKTKIMEYEIAQFQCNDFDDAEVSLPLMKNLSNILPLRFIDELNRKASQLPNSTESSSRKHIGPSFTEKGRARNSLQAQMRLGFNQIDAERSEGLDGSKLIGGTCPVGRHSSRKKISIQKKRSSAYPLDGEGFTKLPDGRVVFGIWKNGKLTGNAKIMYPRADVYIGEVKDYIRHGAGILTLKSGEKYVGSFKNGKCEGYGTKYDQDGKLSCEGIWMGGVLVKRVY